MYQHVARRMWHGMVCGSMAACGVMEVACVDDGDGRYADTIVSGRWW